jgi:hypothetical protein
LRPLSLSGSTKIEPRRHEGRQEERVYSFWFVRGKMDKPKAAPPAAI